MIKRELNILFSSLMFFTRVKLPFNVPFVKENMSRITTHFPLIGIFVGAFGGGLYFLLSFLGLPPLIPVVIVVIAMMFLTGAIHEDGLADVFDGFGGGYTKNRIMEIMQDSAIGTYGVLALILMLFLKIALLDAIPSSKFIFALIVSQSLSRLSVLFVTYRWRYVRIVGKAKARGMVQKLSWRRMVWAVFFGVAPLLLFESLGVFLLLPVVALVAVVMGYFFAKKIGGYTGDCLGAVQQISELSILLFFLLLNIENASVLF